MSSFFATTVSVSDGPVTAKAVDKEDFDRQVKAVNPSNIVIGFTELEVDNTGPQFPLTTGLDFVLPADEELWVGSSGSGSVAIMVTAIAR